MANIIKMVATTFLCCILLWNTATGHPIPASCFPSKLKSFIFDTLPHVRELQNKYELEANQPTCDHVFQLKKFPGCDLRGSERLALSLYRVSLTVQALDNMTMDHLVRKNLETFSIIQNELSKCEATKSLEGETCREHLMKSAEKVPAKCLQNEILLHLIWTLFEDVGFLLPGEHQKIEERKETLFMAPKTRSSRKHKRRRRKNRGRKAKQSLPTTQKSQPHHKV